MKRIKATEEQISDGTLGACINCGEIVSGCEPDARQYSCEGCGEKTVYGLEELLIMGQLDLIDESDDIDNGE